MAPKKSAKSLGSSSLQFESFIIYETICCSKFQGTDIVNAACMGVHFTPLHELFIHIYDDTDTKQNLQIGAVFSVNFSDEFYDYVLAALRGWHKGPLEPEFANKAYHTLTPAPILKSAWGVVVCEVIPMPTSLPSCRQRIRPNIRAKILETYQYRMPRIFNNRAFNLAIESLILTTRVPFSDLSSPEFHEKLGYYRNIKQKIKDWGEWHRYSSSFEVMDSFLIQHNVKSTDLYEFVTK
jgi:hypothetical protein